MGKKLTEKEKAARNTNAILLFLLAPVVIILVLWMLAQLFGK